MISARLFCWFKSISLIFLFVKVRFQIIKTTFIRHPKKRNQRHETNLTNFSSRSAFHLADFRMRKREKNNEGWRENARIHSGNLAIYQKL